MNNFKKVGLTALGTVLVSSTAYSADLTVTGSAGITLTGEDNSNKGNGWTMGDSLTFSGSAEQDNGWNVTMSQEIDGGALDDFSIKVDMGDLGTVTFAGHGTTGVIGNWDDLTPTANEEAHGVSVGGTQDGAANGVSENDSFHWDYTVAAVDGLSTKVSYFPSDNTSHADSSIEYGAKYTGIDGLELAFGLGENNDTTAGVDNTVASIKYTMDSLSVGMQANESDSATANSDEDFTAWGVSYAVSDDLSLSYNISEIDYESTGKENQEATGISFSYTSGSLTFSGAYSEIDNVTGSAASDNSGYELNLSFTF
jgi:outer membrane protein OmpU